MRMLALDALACTIVAPACLVLTLRLRYFTKRLTGHLSIISTRRLGHLRRQELSRCPPRSSSLSIGYLAFMGRENGKWEGDSV